MIIPVIIGIYLFKEALGIVKLIGIILAISAIYMTSTKRGNYHLIKSMYPLFYSFFWDKAWLTAH